MFPTRAKKVLPNPAQIGFPLENLLFRQKAIREKPIPISQNCCQIPEMY
jgi:hypothetical protein